MKKSVIFISISLGLIILLGIGVSYSMWNISVSQDTTNMAESKCFDLSITNKENNISLDNAYPISNDKGKSLTPYTFTITNTCDITAQYNINLEVLNNSTLSSKFIDVMLENNDIKEINLLSNFDKADKVNTSSIESRKLTTGILKSRESKDYSLRLWIDYNTTLEDLNNEIKSFKSKIVVVGKPINFNYAGDMVFNFGYTGGEQTFVAPVSGTYKLETWGAQGGSSIMNGNLLELGGSGGFASGFAILSKNDVVYLNVGGTGSTAVKGQDTAGGYNGGGSGTWDNNISEINTNQSETGGGGGGATHIATKSGLLNSLENYKNSIYIVSGGGGAGNFSQHGGSGGGFIGTQGENFSGTGGTQISGCDFGKGCDGTGIGYSNGVSGGGGGFYGGNINSAYGKDSNAGGGGSGYIGNSLLTNKVMYCYNCEESNEESTKTISTTCSEETPTSYCAKKGNGYARITLVSIDE